ncbi:MAG: HD domain-containing protein [Lachnospiraceae bacterium]|nr:HD domain-containing protein [Lachnospiraceae bacterium]
MVRSRKDLEHIKEVGAAIIASPEFEAARNQIHHLRGNVAAHMINTAYYSVCLCKLLNKIGISTNTDDLIISCLCHDLGIVNRRNNKYVTDPDCIKNHPIESVPIAERLLGSLTSCQKDTIRTHMWPLSSSRPRYREGMILTIIDKYCSILESSGLLKPAAVL